MKIISIGSVRAVTAATASVLYRIALSVNFVKDKFCSISYDFAPGEKFSFSAGISILKAGMGKADWFNSADAALYKAKNGGRNKIEVAE